jgi:hypothetical protein
LIIQEARDPDPVRAMFPYSSVACRDGDHYRVHRVLGPEGCHDNGNSCLCECHDTKEESQIIMSSMKGPFRERAEDGCQIVQVRFPGGTGKTYAYKVAKGVGDLAVGDFAWTEGNQFNPYGTSVAVVKIGSEYNGRFAELTSRLSKEHEPQTITVRRYDPEA